MTDPKREFTDEELIRHFDNMAGRLIGGIIQAPKSCPKCAAIRARLTRRVSRKLVKENIPCTCDAAYKDRGLEAPDCE